MSNGLTSTFFHVLLLNGSALAVRRREKDLVTWMARHNQEVLGAGTVGFDLNEIPFSDDFSREKDFLIRIVDFSKSRRLWERLDYEPAADQLIAALGQFRKIIDTFQKDDVDPSRLVEWSKVRPPQFLKCPRHDVYLMIWGEDGVVDDRSCLICSDK